MASTLIYAEWIALIATVIMLVIMIVCHFTRGTGHDLSTFTAVVTISLAFCWACLAMVDGFATNSRTLNPERFAQFELPPVCPPISLPVVDLKAFSK